MDSTTLKAKPLSLAKFISKTWEIIKISWLNSLIVMLFILGLVIITIIVLALAWKILLVLNLIQLSYIWTFRMLWQFLTALILFIISVLAQFLLINSLLNPRIKLKKNLKSMKQVLWHFLCLTLILNLIFLLASLPLYISIFLLLLNNLVLGIISFIVGVVLILFLGSYLIFSPFILIEKKISFFEAIKKSFILAEGNFSNIFLKILILGLILLILNGLSLLVMLAPIIIRAILNGVIIVIMILTGFAYLFAIYQDFKSIKNL
jgi:hypothetical protein